MRRAWTGAELERLERMVAAGHGDAAIADALGRSAGSIRNKRAHIGLEGGAGPGRPRKHCYATIGAMLDAGARTRDVAAVYGRGVGYATRQVRR